MYDDIARGTRRKFESNRPRAVLFEGPPGLSSIHDLVSPKNFSELVFMANNCTELVLFLVGLLN